MKFMLAIGTVIVLGACGAGDYDSMEDDSRFKLEYNQYEDRVSVLIIADTETGCKYIQSKYANSGGLTELKDENGWTYCGSESKATKN